MKKSALALILAVLMAVGLLTIGAAADGPVASIGDKTYDTLAQAVEKANDGDTIVVLKDCTLSTVISINKSITIDLAGHGITASTTGCAFKVTEDDKTFTIEDSSVNKSGSISANNTSQLIEVPAGELVVKGGNLSNNWYVIYVYKSGKVTIKDGTLTSQVACAVSTNGSAAGSDNYSADAVIDIQGGKLVSVSDVGIYLPAGTLYISGGDIEGATAVYSKCGTTIITGGTIRGTGNKTDFVHSGNGCIATGDALVIEACDYPNGNPVVEISGGEFTSENADAVASYEYNNNKAEKIAVVGGEFSTSVSKFVPEGMIQGEDGKVIIDTDTAVASVNGVGYTTLADAINAATNDSTVKMLMDYTYTDAITVSGKTFTLDLNGKDLKYEGNKNYAMTLCGGADLTIDDTAAGSGDDGMFWSAARVIAVGDGANGNTDSTGATLTVNDGVISSGKYEKDGDETYHCAIAIRANYQAEGDSVPCKVTINSVINGGIYVFGNGAELNIEDDAVILTKSSYAISGNGTKNATNDQGNTVININGGLIEQNGETGAAIYHPQSGTLNISGDPIITGATGIQLCSGTANIRGGTITGEGADSREGKTSDGLISDGAAVSVVNRSYPGGAPEMNISGGAFVSKQSEAVLAYTWNGNEESAWEDASDNVVVSGGSFSSSVAEYVTADFKFELNNKGTFSYYETAEAALDNAEPGAVIKGIGDQAALNVYSLKVVYGNGQADYPVKVPDGTEYILPAVSKPGYIFMGWKCSDGHTHEANVTVTITGNVTFTAVWANMPDVTPGTPDDDDEPVVPDFPFTDVREGQWFYEAVKYVYDKGIMNGMDRYTFDPNGSLTRAMVWTMLARHEGVDTEGGATWYAKAQEWAVEAGVSDGTDPMGNITREQLVTMLWRLNGSETVTGSLTGFTDYDKVSDWAGNAMLWATVNGIIEGDEANALNPTAGCTRAQAAAMIMRFCAYHEADSFGTVV